MAQKMQLQKPFRLIEIISVRIISVRIISTENISTEKIRTQMISTQMISIVNVLGMNVLGEIISLQKISTAITLTAITLTQNISVRIISLQMISAGTITTENVSSEMIPVEIISTAIISTQTILPPRVWAWCRCMMSVSDESWDDVGRMLQCRYGLRIISQTWCRCRMAKRSWRYEHVVVGCELFHPGEIVVLDTGCEIWNVDWDEERLSRVLTKGVSCWNYKEKAVKHFDLAKTVPSNFLNNSKHLQNTRQMGWMMRNRKT